MDGNATPIQGYNYIYDAYGTQITHPEDIQMIETPFLGWVNNFYIQTTFILNCYTILLP